MVRGDLVTVILPGAYGKPRPALVILSDFFSASLGDHLARYERTAPIEPGVH